jgi:hypothetical protein
MFRFLSKRLRSLEDYLGVVFVRDEDVDGYVEHQKKEYGEIARTERRLKRIETVLKQVHPDEFKEAQDDEHCW